MVFVKILCLSLNWKSSLDQKKLEIVQLQGSLKATATNRKTLD